MHSREGITNLAFARAQSLYFGPAQDDARLKCFQDMKLVAGLGVGEDRGNGVIES